MRSVSLNAIVAAALVLMPAIPRIPVVWATEVESHSTAIERLQTLQQSLKQAHAANNADDYLRTAVTMHDFLNGSPNSVLQLMLAQIFAGKEDDATRSFKQFVRMGQSNKEMMRSKQFDALRALRQYPLLHAEMVANSKSKSVASKAFGLTDGELLPEDIDFDARTQHFYITSVLKKEIVAVDMKGHSHIFASGPDKWSMMAVKVDATRRLLWATEVALDGFPWSPSEDWGRSMILLYDLKTGKLLWRIEGPAQTALGDMTLTAVGDAILSDGDRGGVYRVRRETQQIDRLDAGDFISPQTPAMLPGGERALVPDYVRGIAILNLKTKQVSWISMGGQYALSGIDGIYLSGHTIIATQNGTSPERVVRFALDRTFSQVESETVIERSTPTLGDPTHGVLVNGRFYYIANSGWDALDEHGKLKAGASMSEPLIMSATLNTQ
jgi:hypothetical protein